MREGAREESRVGGWPERRGEVGRSSSLQLRFLFFFFNPSKVLPLCCSLPLGNLEIKFIGCVQGINFSGRWKHLEEVEVVEEGE